jgi:hypothetical protein
MQMYPIFALFILSLNKDTVNNRHAVKFIVNSKTKIII